MTIGTVTGCDSLPITLQRVKPFQTLGRLFEECQGRDIRTGPNGIDGITWMRILATLKALNHMCAAPGEHFSLTALAVRVLVGI